MSNIIIPAAKSITITNKFPSKSFKEDTIEVGSDGKYKYYSYLFFDISSVPNDVSILKAELVLFKTDNFFNDNSKKFSVKPLREYFSTYSTYENKPAADYYNKINFYPITSKVAVTINITSIILLWIKNRLVNKGIVMYGESKDALIKFGSSNCDDKYLIPFIRINCESNVHDELKVNYKYDSHNKDCNENYNKCCSKKYNLWCSQLYIPPNPPPNPPPPSSDSTTRQVRVTGTVAGQSIYDIVVNIEVTRAGSGHKDNYYVADEYDNSLNSDSISIDKTYNIAIIPKVEPGDTEIVSLYGAYRE